jgi:hypothetical protein
LDFPWQFPFQQPRKVRIKNTQLILLQLSKLLPNWMQHTTGVML